MHPYQEIVCMDRHSDGIPMETDDPNTLTCQSVATNDAPKDPHPTAPLHGILPGHGPSLH